MKIEASIDQMTGGQEGVLLRFEDEVIGRKLMYMGVMPGKRIAYIRSAPFAGAYYIKVDGHRIAVRDREAKSIIVACE